MSLIPKKVEYPFKRNNTTNDQLNPMPILSQQSCINLTYNVSNEELTLRPILSLHSCKNNYNAIITIIPPSFTYSSGAGVLKLVVLRVCSWIYLLNFSMLNLCTKTTHNKIASKIAGVKFKL